MSLKVVIPKNKNYTELPVGSKSVDKAGWCGKCNKKSTGSSVAVHDSTKPAIKTGRIKK